MPRQRILLRRRLHRWLHRQLNLPTIDADADADAYAGHAAAEALRMGRVPDGAAARQAGGRAGAGPLRCRYGAVTELPLEAELVQVRSRIEL